MKRDWVDRGFPTSSDIMSSFQQDLRYAFRGAIKNPLFTVVVVGTIAIAIAAVTTIFSVVNWALLRGIPGVREAERLATVGQKGEFEGLTMTIGANYSTYRRYREGSTLAADVAGYQHLSVDLGSTETAGARRLDGEIVSENYFTVLRMRPLAGRLFGPAEANAAPSSSVIISDRLWRRQFASARDIVGKTATVNGQRLTVIGVAEEGFVGISGFVESDLWFPLGAYKVLDKEAPALSDDARTTFGRLVVRLKPGVTIAAAESEARSLFGETVELMGKHATVSVEPGVGLPKEQREHLAQTMVMLMAGVGLVLIIACANVANLLLVRGASRLREVALRRSLGASDWRLARQLVTESVLLALAAGIVGVTLALWGTSLLEGLKLDGSSPALPAVPVDRYVLVFTAGLSIATALLFALPPVLGTLRADPAMMMRSGDRGTTRRSRLQSLLVVAQVAVSFILVVGAALFLRTVHNLRNIDLGFRADNVLAASLDLGKQGYSDAAADALLTRLTDRLRARPATQSVAIAALPPFGGMMLSTALPEGVEKLPGVAYVAENMVSAGYFATLGIPLKRGRDFNATDVAAQDQRRPAVAVINEAMAAKFWPGKDPLGQRLVTGSAKHRELVTVIGVVGNARVLSPRREQDPFFYVPSAPGERATIFIRSTGDLASLVSALRQELAAADPNVPLYDVMSLAERVDRSFADQIASAGLTGAFGIIGLLLAAVGLYAVIAFTVVQRTRELAIRVALGANEGRIRGFVVRDGVLLVAGGILLGAAASYWLAKLIESRLFGVSGSDVLTYGASAVGMLVIAILATYLPARRATKVDPMLALRAD